MPLQQGLPGVGSLSERYQAVTGQLASREPGHSQKKEASSRLLQSPFPRKEMEGLGELAAGQLSAGLCAIASAPGARSSRQIHLTNGRMPCPRTSTIMSLRKRRHARSDVVLPSKSSQLALVLSTPDRARICGVGVYVVVCMWWCVGTSHTQLGLQ